MTSPSRVQGFDVNDTARVTHRRRSSEPASYAPGLHSGLDVLSLQRTIGNNAVTNLLRYRPPSAGLAAASDARLQRYFVHAGHPPRRVSPQTIERIRQMLEGRYRYDAFLSAMQATDPVAFLQWFENNNGKLPERLVDVIVSLVEQDAAGAAPEPAAAPEPEEPELELHEEKGVGEEEKGEEEKGEEGSESSSESEYSSDEESDDQGEIVFYHSTTLAFANAMTKNGAPVTIEPLGKGEFGKGFYLLQSHDAALAMAPGYAKEHKATEWAIVSFTMSSATWHRFKVYLRSSEASGEPSEAPEEASEAPVKTSKNQGPYQGWGPYSRTQPEHRHGPFKFWHDFVTDKETKTKPHGFALIKGPLLGTLSKAKEKADKHPTQFLLSGLGLDLLNDTSVRRRLEYSGTVGQTKYKKGPGESVTHPGSMKWPDLADDGGSTSSSEDLSEESEEELDFTEEVDELLADIEKGLPVKSIAGRIRGIGWTPAWASVATALAEYNASRSDENKTKVADSIPKQQ